MSISKLLSHAKSGSSRSLQPYSSSVPNDRSEELLNEALDYIDESDRLHRLHRHIESISMSVQAIPAFKRWMKFNGYTYRSPPTHPRNAMIFFAALALDLHHRGLYPQAQRLIDKAEAELIKWEQLMASRRVPTTNSINRKIA